VLRGDWARRAASRLPVVRVHGLVHYREASAWARGVDDAIDNISRLREEAQDKGSGVD